MIMISAAVMLLFLFTYSFRFSVHLLFFVASVVCQLKCQYLHWHHKIAIATHVSSLLFHIIAHSFRKDQLLQAFLDPGRAQTSLQSKFQRIK